MQLGKKQPVVTPMGPTSCPPTPGGISTSPRATSYGRGAQPQGQKGATILRGGTFAGPRSPGGRGHCGGSSPGRRHQQPPSLQQRPKDTTLLRHPGPLPGPGQKEPSREPHKAGTRTARSPQGGSPSTRAKRACCPTATPELLPRPSSEEDLFGGVHLRGAPLDPSDHRAGGTLGELHNE
ncbi:translation initiation factor IF-2-like [Penaeus monodon]|uniref:translation initiation factor IF-2-like n=1 Tax=Penaeus monodon TaxID=6687 RepID=UPI0018A709C2|nr:translation initiation factor IF-2-like [Penaeus monodon]